MLLGNVELADWIKAAPYMNSEHPYKYRSQMVPQEYGCLAAHLTLITDSGPVFDSVSRWQQAKGHGHMTASFCAVLAARIMAEWFLSAVTAVVEEACLNKVQILVMNSNPCLDTEDALFTDQHVK